MKIFYRLFSDIIRGRHGLLSALMKKLSTARWYSRKFFALSEALSNLAFSALLVNLLCSREQIPRSLKFAYVETRV